MERCGSAPGPAVEITTNRRSHRIESWERGSSSKKENLKVRHEEGFTRITVRERERIVFFFHTISIFFLNKSGRNKRTKIVRDTILIGIVVD